mmetsp:Transcript_42695/g.117829  ORF Transcript_42695/g.117829 Transcript_42695/m.117829 type:complete len:215 (+) Transcript_42695:232-876(+)
MSAHHDVPRRPCGEPRGHRSGPAPRGAGKKQFAEGDAARPRPSSCGGRRLPLGAGTKGDVAALAGDPRRGRGGPRRFAPIDVALCGRAERLRTPRGRPQIHFGARGVGGVLPLADGGSRTHRRGRHGRCARKADPAHSAGRCAGLSGQGGAWAFGSFGRVLGAPRLLWRHGRRHRTASRLGGRLRVVGQPDNAQCRGSLRAQTAFRGQRGGAGG